MLPIEFMISWALYVFDTDLRHMLVMDPTETKHEVCQMCNLVLVDIIAVAPRVCSQDNGVSNCYSQGERWRSPRLYDPA